MSLGTNMGRKTLAKGMIEWKKERKITNEHISHLFACRLKTTNLLIVLFTLIYCANVRWG